MEILGVPDDVDPQTVRPTSEWRLSARTERALALRQKQVDHAEAAAAEATDDQLRAWIANNLAEADRWRVETDERLGTQTVELHDPDDDPDPTTMTREEMIEFVVACADFETPLELIYPSAVDPTENDDHYGEWVFDPDNAEATTE
jgi:hypothetical protein